MEVQIKHIEKCTGNVNYVTNMFIYKLLYQVGHGSTFAHLIQGTLRYIISVSVHFVYFISTLS